MKKEYVKENMRYRDYNWSSYREGDPRISGSINHTKFNRSEGNEVLYLVKTFMTDWGLEGIASGHKIERMIRDFLPYNITTQVDIKIWIKMNWKYY
jgi:hypothetical protein